MGPCPWVCSAQTPQRLCLPVGGHPHQVHPQGDVLPAASRGQHLTMERRSGWSREGGTSSQLPAETPTGAGRGELGPGGPTASPTPPGPELANRSVGVGGSQPCGGQAASSAGTTMTSWSPLPGGSPRLGSSVCPVDTTCSPRGAGPSTAPARESCQHPFIRTCAHRGETAVTHQPRHLRCDAPMVWGPVRGWPHAHSHDPQTPTLRVKQELAM